MFPSLDGDGDVDSDWIETDTENFDLPVNNFSEELPDAFEGVTELYPGASVNYGRGHTFMDTFDADQFSFERQGNLFYPFASKAEWEFASWLTNSGLSMAAIDKCLPLDIVCFFHSPTMRGELMTPYFQIKSLRFSFKTAKALRQRIELLPSGPRWKSQSIKAESHTKRGLQLFYRDAIDCLQYLIHSPSIDGQIEFVPKKIYTAADRIERVYTEWLSGDRAWELQVRVLQVGDEVAYVVFRTLYLTVRPFLGSCFHPTKRTSPKSVTVKLTLC